LKLSSRHGSRDRIRRLTLDRGEREAGSRSDLVHADLLESDRLESVIVELSHPAAEHDRHDVYPELVDETGTQELPDHADAADDLTALSTAATIAWLIADSRLSATKM